MYKVLIVDDDVAVTNYLMVFLMQSEKYEPTIINDSREVPIVLERESFDALILDMDMPNISGLEILKMVKDKNLSVPVIILTGVSDVELAVNAMKLGAFDYLTKPVEDEHLLEVLTIAIQHSSLHSSIEQLPSELFHKDLTYKEAFEHLPTRDPKMIRLFHQAEKMASGDLSIFIWGETGTGKNLFAQSIHKASPRASGPFIAVDAAAEDPVLFPAKFFGQAKDWSGAREDRPGLLEEAQNGTLFLDEIDHLSLPMQVRLRKVIQTGEFYREGSTRIQKVNVRLIVASNHDLTREEYNEKFSRDLLYHLMINSIKLPPLRERIDDIPLIADYFLKEENERTGKSIQGFSPEVMKMLVCHKFPSNLRELRHIIATSVVNADGPIITVDSLMPYIRSLLQSSSEEGKEFFVPRKLIDVQRDHVTKMLSFYECNVTKAASALGITVDELNKIIECN